MSKAKPVQVLALCLWIAAAGAKDTGHDAGPAVMAARDAWLKLGERMYREGLLPGGKPMQATVQGDVPLAGSQAACVSCHRRSGLGAMEGRTVVPPVTGPLLYKPREIRRKELYRARSEGPGTRPAYTDLTLARAIREGIDPAGRPFDRLMPRYPLGDEAVKPLISYLKTLSAGYSPGVSGTTIHFATIVTDQVDADRREAMLDVLEAYVHARNGGTRHEKRRAEKSPFHQEWEYQAYRDWALHVWRLNGPSSVWRRQLEDLYRREPVFAVISGIGEGPWRPVHEFCEDFQVPCLFPNIDLPEVSADNFYSFYFSRGAPVDAEVLAKHLRLQFGATGRKSPVLQVFRREETGTAAAKALRGALAGDSAISLVDRAIEADEKPGPGFWIDLLGKHRPSVLVLWLRDADLTGIGAMAGFAAAPRTIYLSSRLCTEPLSAIPENMQPQVRLVHPFSLPDAMTQRRRQTDLLLRAQGKEVTDERLQVNTFFTARLVGEALMHIRGNFFRNYFIERIEHIVDRLGSSAAYPHLGLGPDRRFASTGGYIVEIAPKPERRSSAAGEWIIP
jgi:hypothetical protein